MKNCLSNLLCVLIVIALLNSCRKDYAREHYSEDIPSIKPDLTVKKQTGITGFITDENNQPVFNAAIAAGDKNATTDEFGYFQVSDALVAEIAGTIKVSKSGYFTGYKTFLTSKDGAAFIRLKLLPENNPGNINAATGGSVDLGGGARLSLPSDAVMIESSGAAYAGTIKVSAHWIDPSSVQAMQLQSPGDTRGINEEGYLRLLNIYSTLAIKLTGNAGEALQIAAGKQANITMPIPASLAVSAPATIKLWSFNETNGLWKQEGTAAKNGNSYTGSVSHFSFWSGATDISLVQFQARIVNAALQPIANAAVGIRGASEPFNAGFGRFGFTDANGNMTGAIPADRQLLLNVLTPCESEAYSHSFTSSHSDIDFGVLTGNMGQGLVTISGNAVDCSNQAITNGYVQTYDNGFYNRINIVNGAFSFTGLACTNTLASYVAVDKNTNEESTPQSISLMPGVNGLGTLTACGTSTVSTINFTLDGVTTTMTEPADNLLGVFGPQAGGWTTLVKTNNPPFNFQFDGAEVTGNNHKVTEVFSVLFPGDRGIAPVPLTVTITEYGLAGGFIKGSFSGLMLDFQANGVHTVSCDFRVKRVQ